jgi:hypothetical protein
VKVGGMPGGGPVRLDSALAVANRATRSTTITLEYRRGHAFITNEGAGRPSESIGAPIAEAAYHPKLDAPERRARAIVARCRKR